MNNRISELWINVINSKKGLEIWNNFKFSNDQRDKIYREMFAELIVRECFETIEKTIETNCDTDGEKIGCEFAITDLKEHFGIE